MCVCVCVCVFLKKVTLSYPITNDIVYRIKS